LKHLFELAVISQIFNNYCNWFKFSIFTKDRFEISKVSSRSPILWRL